MGKKIPRISVLLPTYNGVTTLPQTLLSILNQTEKDFEVVISDDASSDGTPDIAELFQDRRIRVARNVVNVGYPGNLQRAFDLAQGDIIFLMGQDDLLFEESLARSVRPFEEAGVTAVTRPYFWFRGSVTQVDRVKMPIAHSEVVVDLNSKGKLISEMFKTCDQLSGLAMRRSAITTPFHSDIFPCHVYPFAAAFNGGKVVVLPEFTVAVRTESSQSRSLTSIYDKSPVGSWMEWLQASFPGEGNAQLRKELQTGFIGNNAVGLVQIRNYARKPLRFTVREIVLLIRLRPRNLFSFQFLAISSLCLTLPRALLVRLTDLFRRYGLGRWRSGMVPRERLDQFETFNSRTSSSCGAV